MVGQSSRKPRPFSSSITAGVVTGLAPVAALAAAVAFLDPGVQLERGLSVAAATEARLMAEARSDQPARTAVASSAIEEGSEAFWLLRAPSSSGVTRVTWNAPVAPGERVVLGTGQAREILEIVAVEEERPATTRIDTGDQNPPRFTVIGRRLLAPASDLVHVTVDADGKGVTRLPGTGDRAL